MFNQTAKILEITKIARFRPKSGRLKRGRWRGRWGAEQGDMVRCWSSCPSSLRGGKNGDILRHRQGGAASEVGFLAPGSKEFIRTLVGPKQTETSVRHCKKLARLYVEEPVKSLTEEQRCPSMTSEWQVGEAVDIRPMVSGRNIRVAPAREVSLFKLAQPVGSRPILNPGIAKPPPKARPGFTTQAAIVNKIERKLGQANGFNWPVACNLLRVSRWYRDVSVLGTQLAGAIARQ